MGGRLVKSIVSDKLYLMGGSMEIRDGHLAENGGLR